jgi:hypothetical protein
LAHDFVKSLLEQFIRTRRFAGQTFLEGIHMAKIPIKTRLPLEAWLAAGIMTLFSLVSTIMHAPTTSDSAGASIADATLTSAADSVVTGALH